MTQPVFRFAPSPNGRLHLGHALSAITGFEAAARVGGRFLLRIEDIDLARSRPHYIDGIYEDLAWLGLSWETPVRIQSQHFADYLSAADKLIALGVLYPCFASRTETAATADATKLDPEGAPVYSGIWKNATAQAIEERIARGEQPAMRLDIDKALGLAQKKLSGRPLTFTEIGEDGSARSIEAEPKRWGDAVIVRKDVPASYHLAVVVDDAGQGISHVTRGQDLFAATDIHRLLQILLDLPEPVYSHHRLISAPDGRKLSKGLGDTSLKSLRDAGATADEIRRFLALS